MSISFETLVLARKYTNKKAMSIGQDVLERAVTEAVAQSKIYTDEEVGKLLSFDIEVVATLPENPNNHTIYLVPKDITPGSTNNKYFEYIYINNHWELIGDTEIDLSNYYTKSEVNKLIEDNKYVLPIASAETLGGIKIDGKTLKISENGIASLDEEGTAELVNDVIQPIEDDDIASLFD